jgi:energy-coupling factor transporter ATP-binding protein EcfA2
MKALLMHADRDFDVAQPLPAHAGIVQQDLELGAVINAMAAGDELIAKVARRALLNSRGNDVAAIRYRQAVVADALAHPEPVRQMYANAVAALEDKRKNYWGFLGHHPSSILYSAIHVLGMFMGRLRALRSIAEAQAGQFQSAGFGNLFAMAQREFNDAYLARVAAQLDALKFRHGALVNACLGPDGESEHYALRRPGEVNANWLQRLLERAPPAYTVRIAERDMIGAKTLSEMRDRGIDRVANTLMHSVDHINSFFEMLRAELAFHVGCVNLHERLTAAGVPTCFPELWPPGNAPGFRARELRDASLVLTLTHAVVANTIDATGRQLVVVTGANQGGKSTFLRSLGLAQLMSQCGMFVAADGFSSAPCSGLFTHYKREEDASMRQGKLDEELARIGDIADVIRPGAWLLCNESFASTNEREGSELARQMVTVMQERSIQVIFVTHLYTFARAAYAQQQDAALFLRAERLADGTRTHQLREGPPRETSYGEDLYREIFGADAERADPAGDESGREPRTASVRRV